MLVARRRDGAPTDALTPSLLVGDTASACTHLIIGDARTGVRVDLAGLHRALPTRLLFEVDLSASLVLHLCELRRLDALARGEVSGLPARAERGIMILRAIDALAEGASLRAIGCGIVSADEWPGAGDWIKSRARRLVAAARTVWAGGPALALSVRVAHAANQDATRSALIGNDRCGQFFPTT